MKKKPYTHKCFHCGKRKPVSEMIPNLFPSFGYLNNNGVRVNVKREGFTCNYNCSKEIEVL